jgi:hypothetical protein
LNARESQERAASRWALLEMVQGHYPDFIPFLEDVMDELGFSTSDIQKDIAGFIAYGPQHLMVEAQRGQAKTTIVAAYVVWALIHNPHYRTLILSAGGTQAVEISTLIVRIIMNMTALACMRPDKMAGDRTSVEAFDVHHSLKGIDKSPSVACVGVDSNLQGKRADILVPDDVESTKNSATPVQRAKLLHLTKDFTSICSNGRILWMGTPQTMESIYTTLPARGVTLRIWPGRYPTPEQMEHYGNNLAPIITQRLARDPSLGKGGGMLGDQGQPIDPVLKDEASLQKTEMNQGTAYFQLQHMLNTVLMDSMRHPLKTERLVVLAPNSVMPLEVVRGPDLSYFVPKAVHDFSFNVARPLSVSQETGKFQSLWGYVDPAAGGVNGDEIAYAIGGFLNGNVYLLSAGGLPGGYDLPTLERLAAVLSEYPLDGITIEKNMGHGAFAAVFSPVLRKAFAAKNGRECQILEELVSGQKELRIINILAPVIGRGALMVTDNVFEEDSASIARYSPATRLTYSLFYQMAHLSAARNALVHDDRLDALAGLVNVFKQALAKDQAKEVAKLQAKALAELRSDPLGYKRYEEPVSRGASLLDRRRTASTASQNLLRKRHAR